MADAFTPNLNLDQPVNLGDVGIWGPLLNSNVTILDLRVGGRFTPDVSGSSDVTVTADQAQNYTHILTGILTGNIKYILPAIGSDYRLVNNTTGAFTITAKVFGGTDANGFLLPRGRPVQLFSNPDSLAFIPLQPGTL